MTTGDDEEDDAVTTPLADPDPGAVAAFWERAVASGAVAADTPIPGAEPFGDSAELADELLALILDGPKRATAGSYDAYVLEGSPLVASARAFDVFKGERLGAGKKSIAFSIRYQVPNRTLTSEDANKEQAKLVKRLEREFGAEQRA